MCIDCKHFKIIYNGTLIEQYKCNKYKKIVPHDLVLDNWWCEHGSEGSNEPSDENSD